MSPTLMLGDCLTHLKTIPDNHVDLCVTDPPYGLNFRSNRQRVDRKTSVKRNQSVVVRQHYFGAIQNDDFIDNLPWLKEVYRVLKDHSALYVFTHWSKWSALEAAVLEAGFIIKNMIVMNKSNHGMGDLTGAYAGKHEILLFASKGRHELRFPEGRENDIWNVPVLFSGSHKSHPNQKPVSWVLPAIVNSSDEGNLVLDPFMGAGTTGVASVLSGRAFMGMEIDEKYFTVADTVIEAALQKKEMEIL